MAALLFDPFQVLDDFPKVMTKFPGMVSPGFADFLDNGIVHFHATSSSTSQSTKIFINCIVPANNPISDPCQAPATIEFPGSFRATIGKMERKVPWLDFRPYPKHRPVLACLAKPYEAIGQSANLDRPGPSVFPPDRPAAIALPVSCRLFPHWVHWTFDSIIFSSK